MSNVTTVPQNFALSAELAALFGDSLGQDDLSQGVSGGFPVISIRGAKWRMVQGGEEKPIYMPGTKDLAPSIKVVLLKSNPRLSKVFYLGKFVEGQDTPPDCSSGDGIVPYADSPNKQCNQCATCPQNVWGSKINESSGAKVKACADVRRMAILPAEDLDFDTTLLRVPGASLGDLSAYGKALSQRRIPYAAVVTKLSFDADAAYPKINFSFDRVLSAEEMRAVAERLSDPLIEDILGLTNRAEPAALPAPKADDKFGIPADAASQVAANKVSDEAAAAEAAAVAAEMDADDKKPEVKSKRTPKAKVEAAPEPETAAEPAASSSGGDMMDDINAALENLNF